MVHVGDAGTDRIEGFEWAYERSGEKNLYLDAPAGRSLDRLRETHCAGIKAGQAFGPVGHHFQLSSSLRDRGRGKAQDRAAGQ